MTAAVNTVQSLQGPSRAFCTAGRYPRSNYSQGVESLTSICRQAKGGASIRGREASAFYLKSYYSSRSPASKSLPGTTPLLVHALQGQVAPAKGVTDSDLRTPPKSSEEANSAERSHGRRMLHVFWGGRVLPRRIDCLVSETAVAARWSDPGYAYPPAARGRTAGAANLMKPVAAGKKNAEKSEENSQDGARESLGERWKAIDSECDIEATFEEVRKRGGDAVAKIHRPKDGHSDPERAYSQISPDRSYPPDVEEVRPESGAWYSDALVADSSWGGEQADLVKKILNPPSTAAEAKRPTIDLSETIEMFSDRATEGIFIPPSTSYGSSWDGLDSLKRRGGREAFRGPTGEKVREEPLSITRGGPGLTLEGRPNSTGLRGGVAFRTPGGGKDVWRRGNQIRQGGRRGEVQEWGGGFFEGKADLRSRGAVWAQGAVTKAHVKTGQRQALSGQPRGPRHVAGEEVVAGTSRVPGRERASNAEAGERSGESGVNAQLESQTGFGAEFETGFGSSFETGLSDKEIGFQTRLQPGSTVDSLDEELELFVERLGGLGNIAPATERGQEAVAVESFSPRFDLVYANPEVSGGVHAQDGIRGVDPFTSTAQSRRSWKPAESSAEKMDDLLLPGNSQNVGTPPLEIAAPAGAPLFSQTPKNLTCESRGWGPDILRNPPPAIIPHSHPPPTETSETPSNNASQPNPSPPFGGANQEPLPPTIFYDEHFLERFQYTRPPPNRNLPLFLDIKGHDTSPELPMPPPYYPKNSTHEKSGPLPGYPYGRVPRSKLPGPLLNGKRPEFWAVNPNNNKLVIPRGARSASRGKLPGVKKLLGGWTGRGLRTREEVLGSLLSDAEVADLIEGSVHDRREVYLGRDGLTWNMVGLIHTHWRRRPVCKVKCKGIFTVDMRKVLRELERSAGGHVIWQHCGTVLLFRGRNYHWKDPPVLEPPEDRSADKKLTQDTNPVEDRNPGGMGKLESLQLARRMKREPPIVWLDKNGYYGGLVHLVRTFFSQPKNDLAVVRCPQFTPGDVVKLAIQLKALVPAVVFQVDKDRKQRIVLYRNAGWECPTDELTKVAGTDERPTYYPKGPPPERKFLRKVVEEQLLGEEEEDEGVWGKWGSVFDAPSGEETEEL